MLTLGEQRVRQLSDGWLRVHVVGVGGSQVYFEGRLGLLAYLAGLCCSYPSRSRFSHLQ